MLQRYLTGLVFTFFALAAQAQIDTEFWFAAPDLTEGTQGEINGNNRRDRPVWLVISTLNAPAQIEILQPANLSGFETIELNMGPNQVSQVNLNQFIDQIESRPANEILNTGLLVRSNAPITVYYEVRSNNNTDLFSLKGRNALGTLFYTPFQNVWENDTTLSNSPYIPRPKSGFIVCGTRDTTTVTITPSIDILGHPAGVPFEIELDRGQTYYCEALGTFGPDRPAGTRIESDKPITVTTKDDMIDYDMSTDGGADVAADQLISYEHIGTEHIVVRSNLLQGDLVFVLATEDGTEVFVDDSGVPVATLDEGEQYLYDFDGATLPATLIQTSAPVFVFQISGNGDQIAGAAIPPLDCTGSNQVGFARTSSNFFAMNVTIKAGSEQFFTIDGNPNLLQASDFNPVPGTDGEYVYARKTFTNSEIQAGSIGHVISNFSEELFHMGITSISGSATCNFGYFTNFSYLNLGDTRFVCIGDSVEIDAGPGKTSYLWNTGDTTQTIWVNEAGSYSVQTTSGSTCSAVDFVTVNYYEPPIELGLNDTICEGTELVLDPGGPYLFTWQDGSTEPTFTVTEPGIYYVDIEDFQGCTTRDSIEIAVSPRPVTPTISGTSELCSGDDLSLSMSPQVSGQYFWQTPVGDFTGSTLSIDNIATDGTGEYIGFYSVEGCESFTDTFSVEVFVTPDLSAGDDVTVCEGTEVVLEATYDLGVITWNDGSTADTLVVTETGTYSVVADNGECSAEDEVSVTFVPFPEIPEITGDLEYCEGESLALSIAAEDGVTYSWTGPNGFSSTETAIALQNISQGQAGTYSVLAQRGDCALEEVSVVVNVFANPVPNLGPDTLICADDQIVLSSGVAFETIEWSTGDNTASILVGGGDYSVTVTDANGCVGTDAVSVVAYSVDADFEYSPSEIFSGTEVEFTDLSTVDPGGDVTWFWTFGNGDSSDVQDPATVYDSVGVYVVILEVTNLLNCSDTAQQIIEVLDEPELEFAIPNVFTPNGDGRNDTWVIQGLDRYASFDLRVYNRWGQAVFGSEGRQREWDGSDAPDGSYFYFLKLPNGQIFEGEVVIHRE